jgi:phosphoglycerate kinase
MQSVDSSEIINKRVIVRVDFNVPIKDGKVEDDARILAVKPTLDHLLSHNNKLILISYLGRPEKREPKFSLQPVVSRLKELFPEKEVEFVEDFLADDSSILAQTEDQIILLENIRFYPQEKNNDEGYIKKIAGYADVYVNDAFSVSHRSESTVTGLPKLLPHFAGFQLMKEVEMLKKAIGGKGKPRVTILGGAKVSTKIQLIEKFIESSDHILLGGALANTFLAAQGRDMGKSLYEKNYLEKAISFLKKAEEKNCLIHMPSDFIVGDEEAILDIGPETIRKYKEIISTAHTIIWNGPMGYCEDPAYRAGSDSIFYAIAANSSALSIIGGGDTLLILEDKSADALSHISHISTGGGAMLEFIENGSLPGIDALS